MPREVRFENAELKRTLVATEDIDGTLRFFVFVVTANEAPFRMLASINGERSRYRLENLGKNQRRIWLDRASVDVTTEEFEVIDKAFSLTPATAEQP